MKIQEKLLILRFYYTSTRGTGHTALIKEGTKHYQGDKLVLVGTLDEHKNMETRLCETITLNSLDKLRGHKAPLVIDNHALTRIFEDSLIEMEDLMGEVNSLKQDRLHYLLTTSELKTKINDMEKRPFTTFFNSILKSKK